MSDNDDIIEEALAPKKTSPMIIVAVLLVSVLGGSGAALFLAPRFLNAGAATPEAADGHAAKPKKSDGHGGGGGGAEIHLLELENIVVNPAGTQGLRFLMTTVAIDVGTADIDALRAAEFQLRDRVNAVLSAQTMAMLTAPGARDSLKDLLADALHEFFPDGHHIDIYIPHFVIQ